MTASTVPTLADDPAPDPVAADERLHALDILRGLALFGMILVHFHQRMRLEVTGPEDLIGWAVWIFVEQKAWGTFAFLFGVGFAVLLRRLEARGTPVTAIYLRRLGALAVIGLVAEVGFGFNILFTYACWGVALLFMRRWSTPALLLTAAAAAAARPVVAEVSALWAWHSGTPLLPDPGLALASAVQSAARHGGYLDLLAARWRLFVATTPEDGAGLLPTSNLALFVVGLLAVRHRVIDEPLRHARLITGWMAFGILSWSLAWAVLRRLPTTSIPGADWPLADGLGLVQDQWLCFTYIGAVLLLLASRPRLTTVLAPIGQAGRMALTNYMIQVAVLDFLASGYGVALKLRPYYYVVAAVLLFSAEAALSTLWLAHFRFGPLEWLWRTVTYARRQPLRRVREGGGTRPASLSAGVELLTIRFRRLSSTPPPDALAAPNCASRLTPPTLKGRYICRPSLEPSLHWQPLRSSGVKARRSSNRTSRTPP